MGQDFGFIGALKFPAKGLAAWRKAIVDPSKMKGWPEAFGEPAEDADEGGYDVDVDGVLADCNELDVKWRKDGVDLRGLASDDGDTWLTYRIQLVGAVRLAAKHGGEGELIIGSAIGGDDEAWKVVATADGKSSFKALTGKALKEALQKVADEKWSRR